ncbi:MAG: phytanoyl-CoA dioxygenase family protein [Acidimicrobiales bacterium]
MVFIPSALGSDQLGLIEGAVEQSLAVPTQSTRRWYLDSGTTFHDDIGDDSTRERYLEIARLARIADIVASLWCTKELWYMGEQIFLKEGGFCRRTPWHQDTSYLPIQGEHLVSVWISLDPVPRQHALEFVRGSHQGTVYNGSAFDSRDDTAPVYATNLAPRLPDIEAHRDSWDIVSWEVSPGDVIVFHLGVLHGGAGTEPGMRRRTASLRFIGPDAIYDGRRLEPLGMKTGNDDALESLYDRLAPGDLFRSPAFPKVWPK